MRDKVFFGIGLFIVSVANCHAGSNVQPEQYKYTSTACVDSSGYNAVDRVTAKTIAKGNLSHDLGGQVSAKRNLTTVTKEDADSINTTDVITESISMKSHHYMSGVVLINEEKITVNGTEQYCVTVGIKG
jgi:hypothetical protein